MIESKRDLREWLHADSRNYQNVVRFKFNRFALSPISDQVYIWKYIKTLRHVEYYLSKNNLLFLMLRFWHLRKLRKYAYMTGFQIPPLTVGKGLTLWHMGGVVINGNARLGEKCTIHPDVVIGHKSRGDGAPVIGNNVTIYSGARIIGDIRIGNNVEIAPNAVVIKDVPDNVIVGGIPAYVLKNK